MSLELRQITKRAKLVLVKLTSLVQELELLSSNNINTSSSIDININTSESRVSESGAAPDLEGVYKAAVRALPNNLKLAWQLYAGEWISQNKSERMSYRKQLNRLQMLTSKQPDATLLAAGLTVAVENGILAPRYVLACAKPGNISKLDNRQYYGEAQPRDEYGAQSVGEVLQR